MRWCLKCTRFTTERSEIGLKRFSFNKILNLLFCNFGLRCGILFGTYLLPHKICSSCFLQKRMLILLTRNWLTKSIFEVKLDNSNNWAAPVKEILFLKEATCNSCFSKLLYCCKLLQFYNIADEPFIETFNVFSSSLHSPQFLIWSNS